MRTEKKGAVKSLLVLEELIEFIASIVLFALLTTYSWWTYALLFFLPDISFLGYLINPKVGAWCYNILHHKGLMITLALTGFIAGIPLILTVGITFFGHAAFDRILGYGLKFPDSFNHTHLGKIGK